MLIAEWIIPVFDVQYSPKKTVDSVCPFKI
jgi:hypothetical protein